MASILFEPKGVRLACDDGESVFDVARRHGIPVSTSCNGRATCGLCRVRVLGGEEHLNPFTADERKHLGNVYFITKERLSCQARLVGEADVVVQVLPLRVRKE